MTVAPWEGSYAHCDCLIRDSSILPLFHGTHLYAPAIVVFRFLLQMSFTSRDFRSQQKCFSIESTVVTFCGCVGCGLPQSLLDVGYQDSGLEVQRPVSGPQPA